MSFELKRDEQDAWDGFARAALSGMLGGQAIGSTTAAQVAAKFADDMIVERRKRQSEQAKPVGLL